MFAGKKAGCLFLSTLFALSAVRVAKAGSERVRLAGQVPSVVAKFHLQPANRLPGTNQLYLAIGVPLRNEAELNALLRQLYAPHSSNFHKFLTPPEFTARFGPTERQYEEVINFAKANGLTIASRHSNRLVLDVTGSVSNIERAFQVTLRTYHQPTGKSNFYAPDVEPSVPTNLPVAGMWGLSDYYRPIPLAHQTALTEVTPLNYNGSGPSGSYQGQDFRNAYAAGSTLAGTGQTAAVAEFDGYYTNDISKYEADCGYSNVPLQNVLLNNVSGTPGYSGVANAVAEVSLDIEMIIAMAPGLSQVIVYEGNNPYDVFNQIATDNLAKQISCSWSWGTGPTSDWKGGKPGSTTLDSLLKQMAAQGQSFFEASGDDDAYTGNQAFNTSTGPIPVDSVYVTSVGGTTLTMTASGTAWASEKVWNWGNNTGSGGGISPNYTIPTWQANINMSFNGGSTTYRNVPDVALTADAVHVVYNNGTSGIFGGTSCAAPLWAGFCALVNQQAVGAGKAPVGFLNPALYAIGASTNYTACFHDITTGNNIGTNTPGLFYATNGYDLCTGLGTPKGTNLINALAPAPYILTPPVSQMAINGSDVTFSVVAGGQSPFSYRWRFDGTNLPAGGNVSGTASNVLTITSVTSANNGNYSVIVTNSYGSITSSVAALTVVSPPVFSTQPMSQSTVVGDSAEFSATVSGALPMAYQWLENGTNLLNGSNISGATSNVLSLTNITLANAGNYTLVATNSYGSATSSNATLTLVMPIINGMNLDSNNVVALTLTGAGGHTYILEAATNLASDNWIPVATNTLGTNGIWNFADTGTTNFPQRFYRLMQAQ